MERDSHEIPDQVGMNSDDMRDKHTLLPSVATVILIVLSFLRSYTEPHHAY